MKAVGQEERGADEYKKREESGRMKKREIEER